MEEISKQKFMNALLAAGYRVTYENGMPVALCESQSEIKAMVRRIKELAKQSGYNESLGVRVRKASERITEEPENIETAEDTEEAV